MYKHYFTTKSIVEKWHMKMVIDNYLIKDWINEYKSFFWIFLNYYLN